MLVACSSDPRCPDHSKTPSGFYGGDGSTRELAVHPIGMGYTSYRWIAEKYPGSEVRGQELVVDSKARKNYDVMTFVTPDGETMEAWFLLTGGLTCVL
jgi:hypothetical protein